jgi:hypothetical protein
MAKSNFAACLVKTLAYEGGWLDNPKDPGGATMRASPLSPFAGIIPARLRRS